MDHNWLLINFVLLLVSGSLVVFLTRLQYSSQMSKELTGEPKSAWKDPETLLVNLPFDRVCKTVAEQLPHFSFDRGVWQIMDVSDGIPTTIAANLPCLDETDPSNVQSLDVGLLVTINDDGPPGKSTTVKMHFIPYEGLDSLLQLITEGTYDHIQKALRLKDAAILNEQPPAVRPEIISPAPSGAPPASTDDFFTQSAGNSALPAALPQSMSVLPISPAPAFGAASDGAPPGLCPGCSQPINPSFPFCLYCGKNL